MELSFEHIFEENNKILYMLGFYINTYIYVF